MNQEQRQRLTTRKDGSNMGRLADIARSLETATPGTRFIHCWLLTWGDAVNDTAFETAHTIAQVEEGIGYAVACDLTMIVDEVYSTSHDTRRIDNGVLTITNGIVTNS